MRLAADGSALALEVADDGRGLPANLRIGVGLSSMRERAESVGGDLRIGTGPRGGTVVTAVLPLARP